MNFLIQTLKKLKKSWNPHRPLIEIKISKSAILHNLKTFQERFMEVRFAPVLKSNAYGHGLIEIASILDKEALPFFVVDSLFEAKTLRANGIKKKLLVLGYVSAEDISLNNLKNVSFAITGLEQLRQLADFTRRKTAIHLKVDTGMHRQGIEQDEIEDAINIVKNRGSLVLEGLCTHLADADSEDGKFTNRQIETWNGIAKRFRSAFPGISYFHVAASAGSVYSKIIDANVARLGIGLYGINTSPLLELPLKPTLEIKTTVSSVRKIREGETVGYNGTFAAKGKMAVATIPVGYAEGIDRRLSNAGFVSVNGIHCPIVGRVSMNITSVDVTGVPDAKLGDPVTIISSNPDDPNSAANIAKTCGTIPYEILVHIPSYLKRNVN